MPVRTRFVTVILLGMMIGAGGCARDGETATKTDFETSLALRSEGGKEAASFRPGETVTLVITIRNRSGAARSLTLPSSQTHDALIYGEKRKEIWRWSGGRMFAQVITDLAFTPGEARTFTVTWDQTDRDGARVLPGDYQAVGVVAGGAPGCQSKPVAFVIRPGS